MNATNQFDSKTYSPNNIAFRVISTRLLADIKQYQSYILSQVEYSDYEFSRTSKEIAILHSQKLYQWLEAVEQHLIVSGSYKISSQSDRNDILASAQTLANSLVHVVEDHEVFSDKYICDMYSLFANEVHKGMQQSIFKEKEGAEEIGALLFSRLAACATATLSMLRLTLYEADQVSTKGVPPFVCINDTIANNISKWGQLLLVKQSAYLEGKEQEEVGIKNFCSSQTIFDQAKKFIKKESSCLN